MTTEISGILFGSEDGCFLVLFTLYLWSCLMGQLMQKESFDTSRIRCQEAVYLWHFSYGKHKSFPLSGSLQSTFKAFRYFPPTMWRDILAPQIPFCSNCRENFEENNFFVLFYCSNDLQVKNNRRAMTFQALA